MQPGGGGYSLYIKMRKLESMLVEPEQLVEFKLQIVIIMDTNVMKEVNGDAKSTVGVIMRKI